MKLSAYHKAMGDEVEMYMPINQYDLVYASKVFSFTDDIDTNSVIQADEVKKGGTGYCINVKNGREVFDNSKNSSLPREIEHIYPDYALYPQYKYAVGFLTRGCPRNCGFCVVGEKEGLCSKQVADLDEFWRGQKEIKLLDPNILACENNESLLKQLAESKARVDFTQGIDIRLTNPDNIELLNKIKVTMLHFAWDNPKQDLTKYFRRFSEHTKIKSDRNKVVYVLTNYNSTLEEDLYRIYKLRELGYSPYVMIYQKENAPKEIRRLQRWVNCRWIFHSVDRFEDYKG
jgi:hypothetical protein